MQAVALDQFGGPEALKLQTLPVPEVGPDEVLVRVESAGVGVWDPFEREGGYAEMLGIEPQFPYVLGSEGAGVVAAVGESVSRFKKGDRVYAAGFLNPRLRELRYPYEGCNDSRYWYMSRQKHGHSQT